MTTTHRRITALIVASVPLLVSCGGGTTTTGPTAPTAESSFLTGTWRGMATIHRDGMADSHAMTTWEFTLIPNTGTISFSTKLTVQDAWLPLTVNLNTSVTPAQPGGHISTVGPYDSPRGCRGAIGSIGTAFADRIEASFEGADCQQLPLPSTFTGAMTLTKVGR